MSSLETSDLTRLCAGSKYFVSELGFNHCFRDVADIISRAIPETFATSETIESEEFGSLPVKKAKGEGGRSDLATRLGNNYYNDYVRYVDWLAYICSTKYETESFNMLKFTFLLSLIKLGQFLPLYKNLDSF